MITMTTAPRVYGTFAPGVFAYFKNKFTHPGV